MLTSPEKLIFIVLLVLSVYFSIRTFRTMIRIINRGQGMLHFRPFLPRLLQALTVLLLQRTVLKERWVVSILHTLIAWAFMLYFLVNIGDVLSGFIPDFHFLGKGLIGNVYRRFVDVFSVFAVLSMLILLVRRFILNSGQLTIDEQVRLLPDAKKGISRDSLIVGIFITCHVGFRFIGESIRLYMNGTDSWQPLASVLSPVWNGFDYSEAKILFHVSWWLAIGLILAFLPYFPFSKHAHLFMGPVNFFTRVRRSAPGTLEPLDFEAEDTEQFGVARLEHLEKSAILDTYACIMCNRCQDACPAYITGKELSPSALEINKRYYIGKYKSSLANGEASADPLISYALSESALWACTSCAACVEVCPVGNEPMFDILNMRRDRVLMESAFPKSLQTAFNGMERNHNPWNINEDRMKWVAGDGSLVVKTVEENPDFDILFWVGCAGAFETRAQGIARSFVRILNSAGVNFAVLGNSEQCTGDSARRAGNEYLFAMMAQENVASLENAGVKKIVTVCPHCFHTIKNEYPQFGGNYSVMHHSQLIDELLKQKKLILKKHQTDSITFHDPCYLGRHNRIFDAPRKDLNRAGFVLHEMKRNREQSFCCGAGGAQMWKEEESGREDVRKNRFQEAESVGISCIATACPFCMTMLSDAGKECNSNIRVKDIAELIADRI